MCLYGQDLDETTTPVEAGLSWVIGMSIVIEMYACFLTSLEGKRRRDNGGFIGAETVLKQLATKPSRRRIGLFVEGAPARRKCLRFAFCLT